MSAYPRDFLSTEQGSTNLSPFQKILSPLILSSFLPLSGTFSSNFPTSHHDFNQRNMLPFFRQTFPISRSLPLHTFRTLGIFRPQSTVSTSYSTTIPPISSVTNAPLAPLPTTSLLRSLLLHSITSSPRTLKLGTKVMLANLETIDRNFLLKWGVDKTFYVSIKSLGSRSWCSC